MNQEELAILYSKELLKSCDEVDYVAPLFHGTNYNSIYMSKDEREEMLDACKVIQEYLLDNCKQNGCGQLFGHKEELGDNFLSVSTSYTAILARSEGKDLYEYDHSYLTRSPRVATNFAERAKVFGETGSTVFNLIEGMKMANFQFREKTLEEEKAWNLFYEKLAKEDRPVVLMLCGVDKNGLKLFNGKEDTYGMITNPRNHEVQVRAPREIDFSSGIILETSDIPIIEMCINQFENAIKKALQK